MKLGIYLPNFGYEGDGIDHADRLRTWIVGAEAEGLDSIWVTDHLLRARDMYNRTWLEPLTGDHRRDLRELPSSGRRGGRASDPAPADRRPGAVRTDGAGTALAAARAGDRPSDRGLTTAILVHHRLMGGRVLVVGSVNVDLVVAGERLPVPGETVLGGTFRRFHGGKGGNQAVAAARLGARTVLVGAVGDDPFGSEARAALAREHVGLDVLLTLDDVPTGVALILVDRVGENMISVAPGANALLGEVDVTAALGQLGPHAGDVVLVTHEIPTAAAREALRIGRASGACTILNPAPADGIDTSLLSLADIVTPNRGELRRLVVASGGRPDADDVVEAARSLVAGDADDRTVRDAVLVSLGSAGALLVSADGRVLELPARSVAAVDATGAGDALNGAFAAGLADGLDLFQAARRAVAAASLSVTRAGAREGMPTAEELEAAPA